MSGNSAEGNRGEDRTAYSTIQSDLGTPVAEMFPDTHFLMMLPQELLPDDIPVFRDNPHQPVHIFGMVTHQFGEFLQLGFQPLHTPGHAFGLNDLFAHGLAVLAGKRGYNQITFHRNSFSPQAHRVSGLVLSLRIAKSIIPLSFHFSTVLLQFAAMNNIFTMILAGGKGERLSPLTEQRAKPAVPFGGKYRIIDFALSNCLNSGLRRIAVLIQYKSHSLDKHIRSGWNILNSELGEYIASVPPQQRISEEWYRGTADAVYQNMFLLDTEQADYLLILAGDHIYKMNYAEMFHWLLAKGADAVVGALDIPIEDAPRFGVISVDEDLRINRFDEKPTHPTPIPGDPTHAFASMGIYLFKTDAIKKYLIADAQEGTAHDFGKNIIPRMIKEGRVYAFKFQDENKKAVKYWRDIGTLDAYWEANMDLVAVDPLFNLYDPKWPIRTYQGQFPPAKFVFAQDYQGGRMGVALDSVVCGGCIVSGGRVQNSVLSPNVRVLDHAEVRESIVMENVVIG